jgi:hypothetical protein
MAARTALVCALVLCCMGQVSAAPVTIEFEGPFGGLPYAEDGLTFTALSSGNGVGAGGPPDGELVAGTNTIPIRVRAAALQNFDLLSLDVEQVFRTWTLESSAGAVFNIAGAASLDFTGQVGWTNLSYFEFVHDPGEANGSIRADNVRVQFVSEPCSFFC